MGAIGYVVKLSSSNFSSKTLKQSMQDTLLKLGHNVACR